MRNKRLVILLSVLGGIAVVVIILSAIFTIYSTDAECSTSYGENDSRYQTILEVNKEIRKITDEYKHQSIFFFNEEEIIERVNAEVPRAEAYDVESIFPNKIVVKYNLIEEAIQIRTKEGKYLIAGANGKIMDVRDYDSTLPASGKDNGIVSVLPYAEPDNAEKGLYLYNDPTSYDMYSLNVIVGMADNLVDSNKNRAFDKSNYVEIDLRSPYSEVNNRGIIIKMRGSSAEHPYGVTARLAGGTEKLVEMMKTLASWYVSNSDKIYDGTAIITSGVPDRVVYRAE